MRRVYSPCCREQPKATKKGNKEEFSGNNLEAPLQMIHLTRVPRAPRPNVRLEARVTPQICRPHCNCPGTRTLELRRGPVDNRSGRSHDVGDWGGLTTLRRVKVIVAIPLLYSLEMHTTSVVGVMKSIFEVLFKSYPSQIIKTVYCTALHCIDLESKVLAVIKSPRNIHAILIHTLENHKLLVLGFGLIRDGVPMLHLRILKDALAADIAAFTQHTAR